MRRVTLSALLLLVYVGCGPVPHPQPPPGPRFWNLDVQVSGPDGGVAGADLLIIDNQNKGRTAKTGPTGEVLMEHLEESGFTICVKALGYKDGCGPVTLTRNKDITILLESAVPDLPLMRVDGTVFRLPDGTPWVWKGVTAFQIMDRWVHGEDVQPFLDAYKGFNTLVVFLYTEPRVWGAQAWDAPPPSRVVDFVRAMAGKGWRVELVLLTSSPVAFPQRLQQARDTLAALTAAHPTNLFIRLGNEPAEQNGAGNPTFDTHVLKDQADNSGFIYDSGFYEANGSTWFGDVIGPHTKRDSEWARRGHDCFDITHGAVDAPALGKKVVPCVLGEPEKAGNSTPTDYKAYCATGVQFGAGCTLHSETGKFAQLPTAAEAAVAKAALEGLNAFPGDTNRGAYRRIDGDGLRTYVVGATMVRIRPNRPSNPEAGWIALDSDGVLWRR